MKRLLPGLFLLLSACAPTQTGAGSLTPQVMSSYTSPLQVQPGQTLYVQYTYPRGLVRVNDKYFDDLKIDFGNRGGENVRSVSSPAGWLSMTPLSLPQGISVSLVSGAIMKDVVKTNNSGTSTEVKYYERVQATLKVTATAEAQPTTLTRVNLSYSDGNTESEVPLFLHIGSGAGAAAQ